MPIKKKQVKRKVRGRGGVKLRASSASALSKIELKYSRKLKLLAILLVLSALIILMLVLSFLFISPAGKEFETYTLPLSGYDRVDVNVMLPNTVILKSGCLQITAQTSFEQVDSISRALKKEEFFRPNAHDLMKFIFDEYNIKVIGVKIEKVVNGIYFSKLILQQGNKALLLDARPSDAIAIALRFNKPIYIKKTILTELGQNTCK